MPTSLSSLKPPGLIGPQGPTGAGAQGTQGIQGVTGVQGIQGITGVGSSAWTTQTSAYNAAANDRILADTSAGAFTITLPASPVTGAHIRIDDPKKTWGTNNLTVARNGSNITSLAENLVCDFSANIALTYINATIGWKVDFEAVVGGTSTDTIGITMDGIGTTITTGIKGYVQVPFSCTINSWRLLADQSGSMVIDIWKSSYATYPPTVANTLPGSSNRPTLSSAIKAENTDLSAWTSRSITTNDILAFNVDSATTVQRATLQLFVTRT
jgi:hypothetical protein